MADETLALLQHTTRLYLLNIANLSKDMFYQQVCLSNPPSAFALPFDFVPFCGCDPALLDYTNMTDRVLWSGGRLSLQNVCVSKGKCLCARLAGTGMAMKVQSLLQALRRFESMSSIKINGAASIEDLSLLAVELEQEAGAWRVCISLALLPDIARAIATATRQLFCQSLSVIELSRPFGTLCCSLSLSLSISCRHREAASWSATCRSVGSWDLARGFCQLPARCTAMSHVSLLTLPYRH